MTTAVRGAEQLEALGRRLKAAGDGRLRRELLAGIRGTSKGTIAKIRDTARDELPHRGGLADRVASGRIATRTRLTGRGAGVTIVGSGGKGVRGWQSLNAGRLRHPVFGNRDVWVSQSVRPDWFTRPVEEDLPEIRAGVVKVMADVARRIEG